MKYFKISLIYTTFICCTSIVFSQKEEKNEGVKIEYNAKLIQSKANKDKVQSIDKESKTRNKISTEEKALRREEEREVLIRQTQNI